MPGHFYLLRKIVRNIDIAMSRLSEDSFCGTERFNRGTCHVRNLYIILVILKVTRTEEKR